MNFLGKSESEVKHIALETMEGHQRAIMGTMNIEQIYQDRHEFSKQVFDVALTDMSIMGITIWYHKKSYFFKNLNELIFSCK
jgi:flotillin